MSNQTAQVHAKRYLDILNDLYPKIIEEFEDIENNTSLNKDNIRIIRFSDEIKKVLRMLKRLDPNEFLQLVDEETVKLIEEKINFIYEDLLGIQKRLSGDKYIDDLKVPIKKYIENMGSFSLLDYKRWAPNIENLVDKFIGMLTHPDNIDTYKNQIKRMALGTMSQREFEKIFATTKHKMIQSAKNKFESLKKYKKDNENET